MKTTAQVIDHRKNSLCINPLERHLFETSQDDDYLCKACHKPRALHLDDGFRAFPSPPREMFPIRSGWASRPPAGKLLTDRKIDKYAEKGWYSEEFKEARLAKMKKREHKNFREVEGRLIYCPGV